VGKFREYYGSGLTCDGDVCISMIIIGGNTVQTNFTNVKKNCGNTDCSYGYTFMRWLKAGTGTYVDPSLYPTINLEFNSSEPANYYFYRNKYEGSEIWDSYGQPRDGYEFWKDTAKNYSYNLSRGVYTVLYVPKLKNVEENGSLVMTVQYIPSKPVR
jgi:hypothetical protein